MTDAAALALNPIRRIMPPQPVDGWVHSVDGARYFDAEEGAARAPVGHNEAIAGPNLAPLYRRRDLAAVDQHFAMLKPHGVN